MSDTNKLYLGDCRDVIKKMLAKGQQVDLIYLDPPFNSNRTYNMVFKGSNAQQKAFDDSWQYTSRSKQLSNDFDKAITEDNTLSGEAKAFFQSWFTMLQKGNSSDRALLNYLMYMAERLFLMKRLLKETGSIYYHCDPTASHYIKIIMDAIFERKNFKNHIIWHYQTGGASKHWFSKKHDDILFYSKNKTDYFFDASRVMIPRTPEVLRRIKKGHGATRATTEEKLPMDVWTDIQALNPMAKERLGYATQKPVALLDRIIKASCPPDGVVFDPFCGCGTTIVAAHQNNTQWVGCDISLYASNEIKNRLDDLAFVDYQFENINPTTWQEYNTLSPIDKQDYLVRHCKGMPNSKKSGDRGIDGDLAIYLGFDEKGNELPAGRIIYSVKTGKQKGPAMVRELKGTMEQHNATIGVLLIDQEATDEMMIAAESSGEFEYRYNKESQPIVFNRIYIFTAQEVIEGLDFRFYFPPSLQEVLGFKQMQQSLRFH